MKLKFFTIALAGLLAIVSVILLIHKYVYGRPYNLVFVSIDTLRADRLGTYGYTRDTSPAIDEFAKQSVVFENNVAVTSWTIPSHMSMFTGLYPTTHGLTRPELRVPQNIPLLAEILKARGYATLGFTGGAYLSKGFGFSRGFDIYKSVENFKVKKKGLEASIERAEKALKAVPAETPWFLFLHTYDVHCPLRPPAEYESMFKSPDAKPVEGHLCGKDTLKNNPQFGPAEALTISDRYDGTIRWVDNKLSRLFDLLKARGDLEKTVVVITSDHGEEFFEHGILGHERTVHRQVLMVPLIIRAPGFSPARVKEPIGQVDIFPTVLDLLGAPIPENQGVSLVAMMKGKSSESPRPFQFSELDRTARLRSLMDSSSHIIRKVETGESAAFDMISDPQELASISDRKKTGDLERELLDFIKELPARQGEKAGKQPGKGEMEKLKTLGYF